MPATTSPDRPRARGKSYAERDDAWRQRNSAYRKRWRAQRRERFPAVVLRGIWDVVLRWDGQYQLLETHSTIDDATEALGVYTRALRHAGWQLRGSRIEGYRFRFGRLFVVAREDNPLYLDRRPRPAVPAALGRFRLRDGRSAVLEYQTTRDGEPVWAGHIEDTPPLAQHWLPNGWIYGNDPGRDLVAAQ